MPNRSVRIAPLFLVPLLALASCLTTNERSLIAPEPLLSADSTSSHYLRLAQQLEDGEASPYLKAHMLNGDVYILAGRSVNAGAQALEGTGVLLDALRDTLARGALAVPLDSVALFEANHLRRSGSSTALTLITGASVALTVFCLVNTKACFGSCPTFYVADADSMILQAEGFSSSIAPSLEARDIDALYRTRPGGSSVRVEMKNEALETHVVRYVNLLLVPRGDGGRTFRDANDAFWPASAVHQPARCSAPEGDCLGAVRAFDGEERFSLADSTDLATRETLDLAFEVDPDGAGASSLGLVIGARQSLMTTYLLYQALAYMGADAGAWLARLESRDPGLRGLGVSNMLGGIEVLVQDAAGAWTVAGEVNEHGPLATDVHLVPLPPLPPGTVNVRLRAAKGNWRIDYLALAALGEPRDPVRLHPSAVYRDGGADDQALALLRDTTTALTTLPGDAYTLAFELPPDPGNYELFLESRGYYLEWIREEWMKEHDPDRLAQLLFRPQDALRELAPAYKKVEADMEDVFWRSRYAKQ